MMARWRSDRGLALLIVLLGAAFVGVIGVSLVLSSAIESRIAASYRAGVEALYAANAIAELALPDLAALPDWAPVAAGAVRTTMVDGAATGTRTTGDGASLDLDTIVNLADCAKPAACSEGDLTATTADRPWGAGNPRWTLIAYGRLRDLLPPGATPSPYYVTLMAAADPSRASDVLALRAEAFGGGGAHKAIELLIGRAPGAARILVWHEVR
jgi:hypothetical protein